MSFRGTIKSMAYALALGLTASVMGQSTPTPTSQVVTPYWNQATDGYAEQIAARLVAESPQAEAFAATAKFTFYMARRDLSEAIFNLRSDIESSEDFQTALTDYRSSVLRYEQAKRFALRELRENPEFAARAQLVDQLRDQIRAHHNSAQPDFNQVLTIASMKLAQTRELTEAQTIELAGNADVQFARDEMIAAHNALTAQRKQLERAVRNDPALIELRAARRQALIAHVAAAVYADKLADARDQALRFAAFTKVQERYTPGYDWNWANVRYGSYRSTYYPVGMPTIELK